jgi:hypothetical protein
MRLRRIGTVPRCGDERTDGVKTGPLSEAEKQIWGADAVRDPATGIPIERGSGSAHHAAALAATPPVDYTPAVFSPHDPLRKASPEPAAASVPHLHDASPAPPEQRTVDQRLIHAWPEMKQ